MYKIGLAINGTFMGHQYPEDYTNCKIYLLASKFQDKREK